MTGGRDWRTVTASQQRTSDVTGARARVGRRWRPPCHSPADQLYNLRYNQRLGQLQRGPAPLTSRVCWEQGQGHPLPFPPPSLPPRDTDQRYFTRLGVYQQKPHHPSVGEACLPSGIHNTGTWWRWYMGGRGGDDLNYMRLAWDAPAECYKYGGWCLVL